VIRSDNGAEFTGDAMLTWAHHKRVALRLIEPGKPNQNACRIFQRAIARRMFERALVHQSRARGAL
jgi:hypothetical protein